MTAVDVKLERPATVLWNAEAPSALERPWTLACLALASWLCLRGLSGVFLIGDEFHSLRSVDLGFAELARTYDRYGSGLALPVLQKIAASLGGHGLIAYRLPAIVGDRKSVV